MFTVKKIDTEILDRPARVKRIQAGNVVEYVSIKKYPPSIPIERISESEYIDLRTGLLCEYDKATDKSECYMSVRKSLKRLRNILNANCTDEKRLLWVTLTYRENMTDTDRLYSDFEKFWKRFKYRCKKNNWSIPEYISVVEPQGRGAWHIHCMLIFPDKAPFIDNNSVMAETWKHGFTKTKAVHGVDNIGAYFSAYLADLPIDEAKALSIEFDKTALVDKAVDDSGKTEYKQFVKGARLKMYPTNMNIYRTSRSIERPIEEDLSDLSFDELKKEKASSGKLTFSNSVSVERDAECVNIITHEYYNIKR